MTATYNENKTKIIKRSLQHINILDLNASADDDLYNYASDTLNVMIKKWEAQGINLWKRKIGYLFPQYNTASYSLGSSGDNCTTAYVSTFLNGSASASATSLTVDSTTGMTAGDYIGIQLTAGTRQWTTISSVTSSTIVVITDALTTAASDDGSVVSYTTKITRPVRILRSTVKDLTNSSESSMGILNYDEYFNFPVKSTQGKPNNFYYDRLLSGSTPYIGTLYIFPVPSNVTDILVFTYQESLSDITNTTDYADFPQEWLSALEWNLACEMCYHFGKFEELKSIQPKADLELAIVQNFDSDDAPLRFE